MKIPVGIKCFLIVAVMCLGFFLSMKAVEGNASPAYSYTDRELDDLLAPIALYPDPLLAQMLPASTYPAEIADAEAWLNRGGDVSRIDWQKWDESVRTIAHYPDILKMMAEYLDWTADLGEAFLSQPEDVTRSIQRLRWQARNVGNLESTPQQTVIADGDYIEIIPAQPQYVYVPQYDSSVVYTQRWISGGSPLITFGLGLLIGSWMSMDFDWGYHRVIYHGWNRPGWVNHAKPHVRVKDVYINRSRPHINQAWRHDVSRGGPAKYRASVPGIVSGVGTQARMIEVRRSASTSPKRPEGIFGPRQNTSSFSNRGRESRGMVVAKPAASAPTVMRPPSAPAAIIRKGPSQTGSAGHGLQSPKAPSATVIGRESRGMVAAKPAASAPAVTRPPSQPAASIGKAPSQVRPARESLQPAKTPSVAFGGYRGANEAKAQSKRGQTSRQSVTQVRPSAAVVNKGGGPAKMNAPKDKKR